MKKTIAVIFGGRSVEHDVSIITAHIPIIQSLLASGRFNALPIYIAKDGSWYSEPEMNELDYFKRPDLEERLAKLKKIRLLFDGEIASSPGAPRNDGGGIASSTARDGDVTSVIARPPAAGEAISPSSTEIASLRLAMTDSLAPSLRAPQGEAIFPSLRAPQGEAISRNGGGLKIIIPGFWRSKTIKIDVVFPAMHGTFGEDGSLMGLLRMANVPFVGCDLAASAVAMDKVLTKQVLAAEDVPVAPYVWFMKNNEEIAASTTAVGTRNDGEIAASSTTAVGTPRNDGVSDKEIAALAPLARNDAASVIASPGPLAASEAWREAISSLNFPLFVKPAHLGSSIAISKVKNQTELENAIEVAFHYDDKVLIEESVENLIEVTLPIMGNDELRLGALERPLFRDNAKSVIASPEGAKQSLSFRGDDKFFSFQDKYLSGNKKGSGGVNSQYSELPAKIDKELAEQVIELGKKTYRVLGCSGIARIDFLIDKSSGKIYVNEVNTLPGSLYHHNWRSVGVSGVELVTRLIELAEERFHQQRGITRVFRSDVLKRES